MDLEREMLAPILWNLRPDIIISALHGNFNAQVDVHREIEDYLLRTPSKLIFLSSSNVFDAFTNFPSFEYDKTLSDSVYGRMKIKIENALLRLPPEKYIIARLPMIFGTNSPRIREIKQLVELQEPIDIFPNVVINANSVQKFTQQIHYLINQNKSGIFHLGSTDLVHHSELIEDICERINVTNPIFRRNYSSNEDRFLAVLPKDQKLPKNMQISIAEVIADCSLKGC